MTKLNCALYAMSQWLTQCAYQVRTERAGSVLIVAVPRKTGGGKRRVQRMTGMKVEPIVIETTSPDGVYEIASIKGLLDRLVFGPNFPTRKKIEDLVEWQKSQRGMK